MTVTLDGTKITCTQDFHQQIKIILSLSDYYGENLDALWDCLTTWVEMPLTLIWTNFENNCIDLGEYAVKCVNLLKEAMQEIDGFIVAFI